MKKINPILLAAALAAAGFAAQAQTKVYTDEEFQTALTDAANNGSSDSVIDLYSAVDPQAARAPSATTRATSFTTALPGSASKLRPPARPHHH